MSLRSQKNDIAEHREGKVSTMAQRGSNSSLELTGDDGVISDGEKWLEGESEEAFYVEEGGGSGGSSNNKNGAPVAPPVYKPNFPDAKTLLSGTNEMTEVSLVIKSSWQAKRHSSQCCSF